MPNPGLAEVEELPKPPLIPGLLEYSGVDEDPNGDADEPEEAPPNEDEDGDPNDEFPSLPSPPPPNPGLLDCDAPPRPPLPSPGLLGEEDDEAPNGDVDVPEEDDPNPVDDGDEPRGEPPPSIPPLLFSPGLGLCDCPPNPPPKPPLFPSPGPALDCPSNPSFSRPVLLPFSPPAPLFIGDVPPSLPPPIPELLVEDPDIGFVIPPAEDD